MNIIVKKICIYKLAEIVDITYECYPKISEDKPSASHPDINEAYIFNPNSDFLKFYPKYENKETIHFYYGHGLAKLEHIYTEKEANFDIEFINRKKIRDSSKLKINIIFPKVIKNHSKELIINN